MQIDRRITNGLAWAGVLLVVGVPAADLLSAQFVGNNATPQLALVEPESVMPVPLSQRPQPQQDATAVVPAQPAVKGGAVDNFLQSGKALPSYITGADEPAPVPSVPVAKPTVPAQAAKPAPTQQAVTPPPAQAPIVTPPQSVDPVQVAAIPVPAKVAPVPMPLSMRPATPVPVVANNPPVLIVPDRAVPIPDRVVAPLPPENITSADLDDWESGPLSEFLAQQQGGGNVQPDARYDADGYYIEDGQNSRGNQLIGPSGDVYYSPFSN